MRETLPGFICYLFSRWLFPAPGRGEGEGGDGTWAESGQMRRWQRGRECGKAGAEKRGGEG